MSAAGPALRPLHPALFLASPGTKLAKKLVHLTQMVVRAMIITTLHIGVVNKRKHSTSLYFYTIKRIYY